MHTACPAQDRQNIVPERNSIGGQSEMIQREHFLMCRITEGDNRLELGRELRPTRYSPGRITFELCAVDNDAGLSPAIAPVVVSAVIIGEVAHWILLHAVRDTPSTGRPSGGLSRPGADDQG